MIDLCALGPLIQSRRKHDENEADYNIQSALWTASTCASVAYLSHFRHACAEMITSLMTHSLSKLASDISKKLILNKKPPAAGTAFELRTPEPCFRFRLCGMWIKGVPELPCYASKSCSFAANKGAYASYFDTSTQYCLVCFDCQMGLANMQCWICQEDTPRIFWCTGTSTIGQQMLRIWHEYPDTGTQYRVV